MSEECEFKTEREAREWLRDELVNPSALDNQTVQTYLADWLETVKLNLRPKTYKSYEGIVRVHLVPHIGTVRLADLKTQHIQRMVNKLLSRDTLSARTIQYIVRVLSIALNQAEAWEVIPKIQPGMSSCQRGRSTNL